VKEAVRAGVGLAVCSRGVVQRELDRGDLRVVSAPAYREIRTIQLVHSPRWEMQQASAAFVDLLGRLRSELPKLLRLQAS
jgi:DNA-binding transcriptional LysR family regulator